MFLEAGVAAQDYWLQQIHVMAHRVDRGAYAVPLDIAGASLNRDPLSAGQAHPFRTDLDQRRAEFKRRWTEAG
jgi:hypothetical protein